jgi:large subunit ribosomal protein L25
MNITATKREGQTKGERKKRLRQGFIPAAIYGKGLTPLSVEVSAKSIAGVLMAESGLNTVIDLTITGDKATHSVIIDNLERDPLTRGFRNVGFHQVRKGDKVTAQIPIQLVGTPRDVTINGALLEQILDTITVHAQPTDLPVHLDVDVSGMKTGDVLRVADLPHNPKVEFVQTEDVPIASLHVSTTAQQVEDADSAVAAEEAEPHGADAVVELRADADRNSDTVTGTASS